MYFTLQWISKKVKKVTRYPRPIQDSLRNPGVSSVLNIPEKYEEDLTRCLKNYQPEWTPITNNSTEPIRSCINGIGIPGVPYIDPVVFPGSLMDKLDEAGIVKEHKLYP